MITDKMWREIRERNRYMRMRGLKRDERGNPELLLAKAGADEESAIPYAALAAAPFLGITPANRLMELIAEGERSGKAHVGSIKRKGGATYIKPVPIERTGKRLSQTLGREDSRSIMDFIRRKGLGRVGLVHQETKDFPTSYVQKGNKRAVLLTERSTPALMHELGHAERYAKMGPVGHELIDISRKAYGKKGMLLGLLAGAAGTAADVEGSEYIMPAYFGIAHSPRMLDEALASIRAVTHLGKTRGVGSAAGAAAKLIPAFATYAMPTIAALASIVPLKKLKKIRQQKREEAGYVTVNEDSYDLM